MIPGPVNTRVWPAAAAGHLPPDAPIEVRFQDEARVGRKNGLASQWAKRGTRPRRVKDLRYKNACIFGAVCPARGTGAGPVMPFADTDAMNRHLEEIGRTVAGGAHAVLSMDRAGRHTTGELEMPETILPVFLPPRSPELNPVENIWQYIRDNRLSNRVFETCDDIVEASCEAWNKLIDTPRKIVSIGLRQWAGAG